MRYSRSSGAVTAALTMVASPFLLAGCIVPSPSPGTAATLSAVAAVNASNAWAVGSFTDRTGEHELMQHWNGKSWQSVFLPPPIGAGLTAITAVNASNIWAVSNVRTLHFNGLSWRSVPNPAGMTVWDVASARDATVYGLGSSSSAATLLAMTAGRWRTVSAIPKPTSHRPCDGGSEGPVDLTVLKANDVWVVGNTFGTGANYTRSCTFALHWNGATWQSPATPAVVGEPELLAVSARAANDVWAVGERITVVAATGRQLDNSVILHWNGTKWASVPTVDERDGGILRDIDATPAGIWAVGTAPQLGGFTQDMLIKKWTGTAMVDQPVQRLPVAGAALTDSGDLNGVSVRDGVVTSVGFYWPNTKGPATLTDRRNAG